MTSSRDGTPIAFERRGAGAPLILVGGALSDRTSAAPLASLLEPNFTVISFDRRGEAVKYFLTVGVQWMRNSAATLAKALSKGQHRSLIGQTHSADPSVLAPALEAFFKNKS